MAKQTCDPFRGGLCSQVTGFVRPGVAVEKGDLIARDPSDKTWVVPFSSIDTVANAYAGFLGVANGSINATQPDRRVVLNDRGKYMYPLGTASEVALGDYLIPVLNSGGTACENQKWAVAAASTYAIAVATKPMPDHDLYYGSVGERTTATGEADDEKFTLAAALTGLAVGSICRVTFSGGGTVVGAAAGANVLKVKAIDGLDVTFESLAGTAVTFTVDITGAIIETIQGRGTADEAEGAIISTLLSQSINAVL